LFAGARWQLAGGTLTPTLILAAAMMANGFPVVALILEERGMLDGDLGATILGAAAVLATLPFLILAVLDHRFRSAGPAAVYVLGLAAVVALVVIAALIWQLTSAKLSRGPVSDGTTLAVAVIAVLLGAWLSLRLLGTPLLGGFAVGVALSRSPATRLALERALGRVVPVILVPMFFAAVGIRIDPRAIDVEVVEAAAVFTILLVAVASLGGVSSRMSGLTTRTATTIAALLNCRGLVLLALAVDMVDHRLIGAMLAPVFFLGAVATTLMTGPLLAWAQRPTQLEPEDDKLLAGRSR
jgi:Kef-type K+ transport system membrane component KefB